MYGSPQAFVPNDVQWNRPRGPHNPQWRPFHQPRTPFRPRNQGFNNHRPLMHGGSEEHWCETCDRGFPNKDLLSKHNQQHQKCNIDGCQFIAHPKVITKHIQMQHSSGLYKKIANLNNPEDIQKWREERKKKYPTKINIDKKAAELKEKIERGEKMNLGRKDWRHKRDENGQNRDFNNSGQGIKRAYNNTNQQSASKVKKPRKPIPKDLPTPEDNRSLAPFAGIQSLEMDSDDEPEENLTYDGLIEDDDIITIENSEPSAKPEAAEKPVVCSALSSLMCEYESSDEETNNKCVTHVKDTENLSKPANKTFKDQSRENNARKVNPAEGKPESHNATKNNIELNKVPPVNTTNILNKNTIENNVKSKVEVPMSKYAGNSYSSSKSDKPSIDTNNKHITSKKNDANVEEDDDSGPDEVKVEKKYESINVSRGNDSEIKHCKKKVEIIRKRPIFRKPKPKVPSTLIYKLLSKEMKQERNQVLQCIRYIRKNNYFDKIIT